MVTDLQHYAWPVGALGEALALLQQKGRHPPASQPLSPEAGQWDIHTLTSLIEKQAAAVGLEVEPTQATYGDLETLISAAAPALLLLPGDGGQRPPRLLLLCRRARYRYGRRQVALLGPDRAMHWLAPTTLQDALCEELIAPQRAALQPVLEQSQLAPERRQAVQRALLTEMLGNRPLQGYWLLRLPPGAPLRQQLAAIALPATVRLLLLCFGAQLLLGLLAWWLIGGDALQGQFEWGWLTAWALLLVSTIPLQWLTNLAQSTLSTKLSGLFKQRLLYGALQLPANAVRQEGAGHFLGRVLAADALEQLALNGGFVALLALLQVAIAGAVLAVGAGGLWHATLLGAWLALILNWGYRYFVNSRAWDETHRTLTNDLVERMVGHRTRLVQEEPAHWHASEDVALAHYIDDRYDADRSGSWFKAVTVRGWVGLGLGWLLFIIVQEQPTTTAVAVSLGGVLLAQQALTTIVLGVQSVVAALLAWQEVSLLFHAAAQRPMGAPSMPTASSSQPTVTGAPRRADERPLLALREVEFRYRPDGRLILPQVNLTIRTGDRLLLEGPSGGGKSTLAALLAGLYTPNRGLLLLNGLDQETLGLERWRQRVVTAPQFHENHILTGSLAFNLLMGRRWPPQPEDLREAESICEALGLGELLARMPAGIQQIVGESGWQLSHGERSRLYIARALLQQADLMILDESFGALDPVTLEKALQAVVARAPTLLVIAHP